MSSNHAIIDIGSNGVRMVIGRINGKGKIRRELKVREPIRLGEDAFSSEKQISQKKLEKTLLAFKKFKREFSEFKVDKIRAVATSALREAENKDWFIDQVFAETGISIDVIDGVEEAELINKAVKRSFDLKGKTALLMDIGGGSIEFHLSRNGKLIGIESFKLGTVRVLKKVCGSKDLKKEKVSEDLFKEVVGEILNTLNKNIIKDQKVDLFIGTGGNLERLAKLKTQLFGETSAEAVRKDEMEVISDEVFSRNYQERVRELGMRKDRADVILPAVAISQGILESLPVDEIQIPRVGLREGVLVALSGSA